MSNQGSIEQPKNFTKKNWRHFDTELRLLTLEKCFKTVIAEGTRTILFIPEIELNIVDKLLASALNVRAKAQSQGKTSLKKNRHR
jgi:hypothetical protein